MTLRVNQRAVVHELVDGEVVAVNLDTGCYFSMEGAAAVCWSALVETVADHDLVELLARRFGVGLPEVRQDVARFVAELVGEGLVVEDPMVRPRRPTVDANDAPPGQPYMPPALQKFEDMRELLLLDPIHDVDESGWPVTRPDVPSP